MDKQKKYKTIIDWHNELDSYCSPNSNDSNHLAILNDPKWLDILSKGMLAKQKLELIVSDDEKEYLRSNHSLLGEV